MKAMLFALCLLAAGACTAEPLEFLLDPPPTTPEIAPILRVSIDHMSGTIEIVVPGGLPLSTLSVPGRYRAEFRLPSGAASMSVLAIGLQPGTVRNMSFRWIEVPIADLDGDATITVDDLKIIRDSIPTQAPAADLNRDGRVNILDMIFARSFMY